MESRVVVVLGGPIASGKTSLAAAVRRTLGNRGVSAATIDLDLVYEVLEGKDAPKDNGETWSRARRLAASLTDALFDEGVDAVIAEGDFLDQRARSDFVSALRSDAEVVFVTLSLPWAIALERAKQDPTRGISRDPVFLRRHYEELSEVLRERPATDLVIDTSKAGIAEAAHELAGHLLSVAARTPR
jgi:chloramphenicol 3-O-phosphotransferase